MAPNPTPRTAATRSALLEGAFGEFALFGYKRSSMEGVARRAGVSRATLYLHWPSKDELFRALAAQAHDEQVVALSEAAKDDGGQPLAERLVAVLEARMLRWVALSASSPHAAELYAVHARLCGDIALEAQARSARVLAGVLRTADKRGEVDLAAAGLSAPRAAAVLIDCAQGAKGEDPAATTPEQFSARLRAMVRVVVRGLEPR